MFRLINYDVNFRLSVAIASYLFMMKINWETELEHFKKHCIEFIYFNYFVHSFTETNGFYDMTKESHLHTKHIAFQFAFHIFQECKILSKRISLKTKYNL
jgi:hypothetical protein